MVASVKAESVSSSLSLVADQKALTKALAVMARVADRKSTMPILAHVAIRAGYGGCAIVATDLNLTVTYTASWSGTPGGFAVPAKQLADIVKSAPGEQVWLDRSGPGLRVTSGGVDTTLIGIPDRDFPKVPAIGDLPMGSVNAKRFAAMLDRVLFSVCLDETRFQLNGVRVEIEGSKVTMVSTDGHRLTLAQDNELGSNLRNRSVILPAKAAREIVKLIKSEKADICSVGFTDWCMFVKVGGYEIAAKLIDAQFPPYWQVIPKDHTKLVTVDRTALIMALKRCKPLCCETRGVKLTVARDRLTLTADDPDNGTATESMVADTRGEMSIGANPKYLLDVLAELQGERVTLALGGELDPVLIRSADDAAEYPVVQTPYLGVVMPMRI